MFLLLHTQTPYFNTFVNQVQTQKAYANHKRMCSLFQNTEPYAFINTVDEGMGSEFNFGAKTYKKKSTTWN